MAKWIETMADDSSSSSEEEEALSLCDLPIKLATTEDNLDKQQVLLDHKEESDQFEFGWWGNNCTTTMNINASSWVSLDSQMCAADELFFNGQILPLRHSLSSETALLRSMSTRSDSLDHSSVTRFIGSRSSSIGSHYSSASSSSINSYCKNIARTNTPALQKLQLPIQPSPKHKTTNLTNIRQQQNPRMRQKLQYGSKSTVWDFFRTGLVRAPEMDLRDLHSFRKSTVISRSSSSSKTSDVSTKMKSSRRGFFHKVDAGGRFLSGGSCKCSVDTVLPTLLTGKNSGRDKDETLLLQYSKTVMMGRENPKKEKVKEKKEAMSRRRASEWLKELSLSHENSCGSHEMGKRMIPGVP